MVDFKNLEDCFGNLLPTPQDIYTFLYFKEICGRFIKEIVIIKKDEREREKERGINCSLFTLNSMISKSGGR